MFINHPIGCEGHKAQINVPKVLTEIKRIGAIKPSKIEAP
jgi:hypothetical protein